MNRYMLGLSALLITVACGGSDAPPSKPKPKPKTTASSTEKPAATSKPTETAAAATGGSQDWDPSKGTATVSGKIKFEGAAPERKPLDMSSDAGCKAEGALEDTIVVNGGGLANVVVSVSGGLDNWEFDDGSSQVDLYQKGCVYTPHVLALQAGDKIVIHNEDEVVHNVHSYSKRNSSFNQAQPAGAPEIVKEMKKRDKMFPIKCDMHAWMSCQVVVFDHPFFTVSGDDGSFTLPKLPAGTYTLRAEHEKLGTQTAEVTVTDGGTATVDFSFSLSE